MNLTPMELLWGLLALSAVALSWSASLRSRQRRRLRKVARDLQMHFIPYDQFKLGVRLADQLPAAAAAAVEVRDVIYCLRAGTVCYLFTVRYTRGLVRTRKRICRVGAMVEERDNPQKPPRLILSQENGDSADQYIQLALQLGQGGEALPVEVRTSTLAG